MLPECHTITCPSYATVQVLSLYVVNNTKRNINWTDEGKKNMKTSSNITSSFATQTVSQHHRKVRDHPCPANDITNYYQSYAKLASLTWQKQR